MSDNREEAVDRALDILEEYLTIPRRIAKSIVMGFFATPYFKDTDESIESTVHNVFEYGVGEDLAQDDIPKTRRNRGY